MEDIFKVIPKDEKILWKIENKVSLEKAKMKKIRKFFPHKEIEDYYEVNLITNKHVFEKSYAVFLKIINNWYKIITPPLNLVRYQEDICYAPLEEIKKIYIDDFGKIYFITRSSNPDLEFHACIFKELDSFESYEKIINLLNNLIPSLIEIEKTDENKHIFKLVSQKMPFESIKLKFIYYIK